MPGHYKFALVFLITISSCKKSTDSPTSNPGTVNKLDATGTWSVFSSANASNGYFISSAQYPCLSNNKMILNPDGTTSRVYKGTDTCYISSNHDSIEGFPGDPATPGTWTQEGNSITLHTDGVANPGHAEISKTSTGYQLVVKDSVVNSIAVSTLIK